MDMSKNKLIFIGVCAVLLFIAVVFAVVSLFTAGDEIDEYVDKKPKLAPDTTIAKRVPYGGTDPILSESTGSLTVFEPEGGWQLTESTPGRFQIQIPSDWVVAKESFYGAMLEAYEKEGEFGLVIFRETGIGEDMTLAAWLDAQGIDRELTPQFISGYPGVSFSSAREGSEQGVVITTFAMVGDSVFEIICSINTNGYTEEDVDLCRTIFETMKFF
jgi:hypothetical protein